MKRWMLLLVVVAALPSAAFAATFTADGHLTEHTRLPGYDLAAPLVDFRRQDLGQYLFVRARARRPPRNALPSFLYRSRPEGEIVAFD